MRWRFRSHSRWFGSDSWRLRFDGGGLRSNSWRFWSNCRRLGAESTALLAVRPCVQVYTAITISRPIVTTKVQIAARSHTCKEKDNFHDTHAASDLLYQYAGFFFPFSEHLIFYCPSLLKKKT